MMTALFMAIHFFSESRDLAGAVSKRDVDDDGGGDPDRGDQREDSRATACSPAPMPVWASAAALATMSRRFFGLTAERATPAAADLIGAKGVERAHFGVTRSSSAWGRPCHCRSERRIRSSPRASSSRDSRTPDVELTARGWAPQPAPSRQAPPVLRSRLGG
jgi:hypothetical protein